MNGIILDTNCISELIRSRPDPKVAKWIQETDENTLFLSVLTLGEIRREIELLEDLKRKKSLENWVHSLNIRFQDRVLPITIEIAERWGGLLAKAKQEGKPVGVIDGLIAATALQHNLTVATRNAKEFHEIVATINPWD